MCSFLLMNINEIKNVANDSVNTIGSASNAAIPSLALSAGGSILSTVLNQLNLRSQQKFAARQAELDRQFQREMLKRQMAYNSPLSQVAMMRAAGQSLQGSSVDSASSGLPSGAMASPPSTPQASLDFGASRLAEMVNAYANFNSSLAANRQAGVSEYKAPSEVELNKENRNLASANAVYQDAVRLPMVQQIRETIRLEREQTNRQQLENMFLPQLMGSQIHMNEAQANYTAGRLAFEYTNLQTMAEVQRLASRLGLEGAKYSADKSFDAAVQASKRSFISSMTSAGISISQATLAWAKFDSEMVAGMRLKQPWLHDAASIFSDAFGFNLPTRYNNTIDSGLLLQKYLNSNMNKGLNLK